MVFRGLLIVSYFYLLHLLISSSFLFSLAQHHPIRPVLSESFNAQIEVIFQSISENYTVTGEGFIGRDYKKLDQLVNLQTKRLGYPSIYYELKRYDKQRVFRVEEDMREGKYCLSWPFPGPFGEVWDWVGKAKFVGTIKVDGNRFDVWNYTEGIYTQSLWMNRSHIHKPVRYIAENTNINISMVDFKIFHPSPPTDPDEFAVPPICQETMLPTAKHYMNFSQDFDDTENE